MMKLNNKLQNSNYNLKSNKGKSDRVLDNYDVFGKDLRVVVEGRQLPELICMLGYIIKHQGVQSQGVFRISGNKTRMDELRTAYGQSRRLEIGSDDIHNVTGLFKSFLREIPGGVIPYPQSLDLIKATRIYKRTEDLDLLTNELIKLPVPHYNLLKFTCSLLQQISDNSSSNLMTSDNLGTVFGPTFFASVEDMSLLPVANTASAALIHHYSDLFKVSAPVHTNLNQINENGQRFDDTIGDSSNSYMTKNISDNITTIRFGDSCLLFNSNGQNDKSLFEFSIHNEELQAFPELPDNFVVNHSSPIHSQFSNSLNMALRMCITNHLFSEFQESDFMNTSNICNPRLLSDVMLNSQIPQVQDNFYQMKRSPYNLRKKIVEKTKSVDDASGSSLPRREMSANMLQCYFNDPQFPEMQLRPTSQLSSDVVILNEINFEKPLLSIPQLDFSTLNEPSDGEKEQTEAKNQQFIKHKPKNAYDNSHNLNLENKSSGGESQFNMIKKNISNLKSQLRQFEDNYYAINGVRPDKLVKTNNEWYSKTIIELRLLRQEKEQHMNCSDKTDESELGRVNKKKAVGASGDVTDNKSTSATVSDIRSAISRPMSALSEIAVRMTPSNESGRSNTLNSMTTVTNHAGDLSQEELDHLKSALEKISNHLIAERVRDHRPNDLESMTLQQIETEKVSMQKALLNFESTYGRKKTPNAVYLMRPLYDRYRQVKKRLSLMIETRDFEYKIAQRTLDNHSKPEMFKSAWTSDRPMSTGLQSLDRINMVSMNTRPVYMPPTQFEISEEYTSPIPKRSENSSNHIPSNNIQSQRKNVRTIQYHKTPAPHGGDISNIKRKSLQNDECKSELQQLQVEKKELQRILKDFENKFERDAKRKIEKLDRLPMDREYSRYKTIKNRIKELEELMENSLS